MDIEGLLIKRAASVRDALSLLDRTGSGVLLLVGADDRFERTITDGDLRRLMLAGGDIEQSLESIPIAESIVRAPGVSRRAALEAMQKHVINHLPIVDEEGRIVDLLIRADLDEQVLLSTPHMGDTERDYVEEAFRTNWIAPLGPNVDAFEKELAEKVGSPNAVALISGTAAIHLALRILDVGPGDTVFCSTLTFVASVSPIIYQGAEPVLIDSEPESWNMSPQALEKALEHARREGRLPKAVIVVSLYGQSADMDPILALCERYGVDVVEDAAESLGAKYKDKPSGTFGRVGVYSFNGNKIITTSGGGMLVTPEKELADRARFLATQARDPAPHYQHSTVGYNYRLSNILAGVGRGQLQVLEERVAARRRVFEAYRDALSDRDWLEWMPEPEWSSSTRWLTAGAVRPDAGISVATVIGTLSNAFIEARPVWKPMHLQPVFSHLRYVPHANHSVSDGLFERGICLPSGSNLSDEHMNRVIDALRSI